MKIQIKDIDETGKYGLKGNPNLFFTFENGNELILDKKSAFNIAWTLIDSLGLLNNNVEEFLYDVEEEIEWEEE